MDARAPNRVNPEGRLPAGAISNNSDPNQLRPIHNPTVEARLKNAIVRILREHDAPLEY